MIAGIKGVIESDPPKFAKGVVPGESESKFYQSSNVDSLFKFRPNN